jgi:hypothetical protein
MNYYKDPFADDGNHGFGKVYRNMGAALFYLLRPNAKARIDMTHQFQATMKPWIHQNLTSMTTSMGRQYFGLPIRGMCSNETEVDVTMVSDLSLIILRALYLFSALRTLASDKCRHESTCLSFDRYMELMTEMWRQYGSPHHRGTILLTSEDAKVLPLRLKYTQNLSFPLDIWVNHGDVQPDSGVPKMFRHNADDIMVSSLTAIQIQLQASYIVANCCSNFHSLLRTLVNEGCGRDPRVKFDCLDQSENLKYRICCAWTHDSVCEQIKRDHELAKDLPK